MRFASISFVLLLLPGLAPSALATDRESNLEVFDACRRTVSNFLFDKRMLDEDWALLGEKYRGAAARAANQSELHDVLGGMLAELGVSHASVLDGAVYRWLMAELQNKRTWTFGMLLEETIAGQLFVRALYEGGPGPESGLRVGDRVVRIDAVPALRSPHLVSAGYDPGPAAPGLFFLRAAPDRRLDLEVQLTRDRSSRAVATVEARKMNAVDAARNSVSVVSWRGLRIGLAHVWYCSRGVVEVLTEALQGPLAHCDAVVIDLRGRGGYSDVATRIVNLFRRSARSRVWSKPVAFLIDEMTRSAKEILSYKVREYGVGPLVGMRTEGAVLAAGFFKLPDGSYLELPITRVPVGGVDLEGVGVAPDHEIDFWLPYSSGRDPILERACEVLSTRFRRVRLY